MIYMVSKEKEREELHRAIWSIADSLRGSVSGWDFKSYVLGLMFYRYISENLASFVDNNQHENDNPDFSYAALSDEEAEKIRDAVTQIKGFFILPSQLFCNMVKAAGDDENLNITLENVFRQIEDSAVGKFAEQGFAGLFFDMDFNSAKLGATLRKRNENLTALLNGIANMRLGEYKDHSIDAFGDAYEYLISMYASNAGKSGGEFFTPTCASKLLARLVTVGLDEVKTAADSELLQIVHTVQKRAPVGNDEI